MSVANSIQKGEFDLNLISLRKPLEFPDNTIQSTAYTGSSGGESLLDVLTDGNSAGGLEITDVGGITGANVGFTLSSGAVNLTFNNPANSLEMSYTNLALNTIALNDASPGVANLFLPITINGVAYKISLFLG